MVTETNSTHLTIIGGGFAGLAAALRLQQAGVKLRILEKRPFFGGRAYSFQEPKTGNTVDNGQHLLMGAYHHTFEFLKSLDTYQHLVIQNGLEVSFAQDAQNFFNLKCPNLPAPLHLALGLLRFKGLHFQDKRKMAQLIRYCKKLPRNGIPLDELSVTELFQKTKQTPNAIKTFWEPVGLATLNEPMDQASAALFVEVLRQGLLAKKSDSNLAIPKVGFSELYAKPAQTYFEKQGVPLHFQTQITQLEREGSRWLVHSADGKTYASQALLLAIPPNALAKIFQQSGKEFHPYLTQLQCFQPAPIISINLWYENFTPKESFVGLLNSPIHWIFNKAKVFLGQENYLSLVISGAYDLSAKNKLELVELAKQELQKFYPVLKNQTPYHAQVIKENEATFSGRKGLARYRPMARTVFPRLYLAGDWTATGLPATIESAVKSGHQAAQVLLEDG